MAGRPVLADSIATGNSGQTRAQTYALLAMFGLIAFALILALASDKHLSADGANYFRMILDRVGFTRIDGSRQFANYLSQAPVVLLVKAGAGDIESLKWAFGASLALPWLLASAVSWYALRGGDRSLLLFLIISMVAVNLPSDYILAGEHHVMALLCWPIMFILLRRVPLGAWEALLLWVLLYAFTRLYQTAAVPATLFFLLGLRRFTLTRDKVQRTYLFGAMALCIVAVIIAIQTTIDPRDPGNRAAFLNAMSRSWLRPEVLASTAFIALLAAGWSLGRAMLTWLSLVPVTGFALLALGGGALSAAQSFDHRSLSAILLTPLLLAAVAVHASRRRANPRVYWVTAAFTVCLVTWNLAGTLAWRDFREQMHTILHSQRGFVPVEETLVADSDQRWGWTNDQLSVIWSNGCVQAIVINARNVKWQPKGPPETFHFSEFSCYTEEFLAYEPNLCLCRPAEQ